MPELPPVSSNDRAALGVTADRESSRKAGWTGSAIFLVVLIGALLLGNLAGNSGSNDPGLQLHEKLLIVIGLIPVVALALATHEAGHVLAGRAVGFQFLLFVVGPLQIDRLRQRLSVGLNRNIAYYGGVTIVAPQDAPVARSQLRWVMAGGPLASLVAAALALLGFYALGLQNITSENATLPAYYGRIALQLFGFLSLGLGLITLLPNKLMGMPSDGARLIELSRNGPTSDRDFAVMLLGLHSMAGRRPRLWDAALIANAARNGDHSLNGVLGQLLAYYYELDRGRADAAGIHLERVLEHADRIPALYQGTIFLEAAYYFAAHRQDAAAARAWFARAQKAPAEAHLRHRSEAAVLLVEGHPDGALRSVNLADRALSSSIEGGMVLAHHDQLRSLQQSAERTHSR